MCVCVCLISRCQPNLGQFLAFGLTAQLVPFGCLYARTVFVLLWRGSNFFLEGKPLLFPILGTCEGHQDSYFTTCCPQNMLRVTLGAFFCEHSYLAMIKSIDNPLEKELTNWQVGRKNGSFFWPAQQILDRRNFSKVDGPAARQHF